MPFCRRLHQYVDTYRSLETPSTEMQSYPNDYGFGPMRPLRKKIILCFDGTGNKFSGTDADSNILKIYRMLDRNNGSDKHYYQPGIGTYVNTRSLSHTSIPARLNSWYQKARDSAVGCSFDEHVMGAYKFLMATYEDDDIFLFGFSRGAYVARFLAEMLDHVGLLSSGNEEMARFAWKAFAQWQERQERTEEEAKKKKAMFTFLQAFRETFSRPVRRIRFMGLFDTVNSVPRFETAWMQRSKFPYSARSSAKVIRHAVSIDERRAKFRQDLISQQKSRKKPHQNHHRHQHHEHHQYLQKLEEAKTQNDDGNSEARRDTASTTAADRYRRPSQFQQVHKDRRAFSAKPATFTEEEGRLRPSAANLSRGPSLAFAKDADASSVNTDTSQIRVAPPRPPGEEDDDDEAAEQDIEELWFPGCHADLGGGWPLNAGEEAALSHGPLVWMVREAQRAGLDFNSEMMIKLKCCDDKYSNWPDSPDSTQVGDPNIPEVQVTSSSNPNIFGSPKSEACAPGWAPGLEPEKPKQSEFHRFLHTAATKGTLHDCLEFGGGLKRTSVLSWKIMEWLPFRRMDLQPDGSWVAISFPLPMSEPRDIPYDAKIHNSAIRRMEADENYRPGNLIVGGGGRGVKKAPQELGIGEWEVWKGKDDPVGEVHVRKDQSLDEKLREQGR